MASTGPKFTLPAVGPGKLRPSSRLILDFAQATTTPLQVEVEVPMTLHPFIDLNNRILPGPLEKHDPAPNYDTSFICQAALSVMFSYLVGPGIGIIASVVGTAIAEGLANHLISSKILKQDTPTPNIGGSPNLPPGVRLRTLLIDPSALIIRGFWEGLVIDPHRLDPSVNLYWSTTQSASQTVLATTGTFQDSCSGDPQTFSYTARPWDSTVKFTISVRDVPHPVRYDDWWLWHDGVAHKLAAGPLTFPGHVVVPTPPRHETLQARDQIVVKVEGSNDQGYSLSFRAEDSNVPFAVSTRVVDGSGRSWPLNNYITSQGVTFEYNEDYIQFHEECVNRIVHVISRYKRGRDVPVWDKVTSVEA